MNNEKLQELADTLSQKHWKTSVSVPVEFCGRIKALGSFRHREPSKALKIKIKKGLEGEELIDTLLHELCHWYCFTNGLEYKDGSKDFEDELRRVGATSTGVSSRSGSEVYYRYKVLKEPLSSIFNIKKIEEYIGEDGEKVIRYSATIPNGKTHTDIYSINKFGRKMFRNEELAAEGKYYTSRKALLFSLMEEEYNDRRDEETL